ncbi:hypothetical protein [Plastoroseomonas arctica]|uniref:Uncharacterized protein n=1 Tax=Plastoroseomonas arctica TaxID=1509237 RepID=A0AAF1JX90_9PROT|nr:hypothetical protein [Plastoroseomonas arctica]MBR0655472.1 hypothetical protein [Plastoroseomonas arctica]
MRIPYAGQAGSAQRRDARARHCPAGCNGNWDMLDIVLLLGGLGLFAVLGLYVRACGQV